MQYTFSHLASIGSRYTSVGLIAASQSIALIDRRRDRMCIGRPLSQRLVITGTVAAQRQQQQQQQPAGRRSNRPPGTLA